MESRGLAHVCLLHGTSNLRSSGTTYMKANVNRLSPRTHQNLDFRRGALLTRTRTADAIHADGFDCLHHPLASLAHSTKAALSPAANTSVSVHLYATTKCLRSALEDLLNLTLCGRAINRPAFDRLAAVILAPHWKQ